MFNEDYENNKEELKEYDIYCPAHGKITDIIVDNEKDTTLVSIFLNVFDIHRQYCPVNGFVREKIYHEGKFENAGYFEKTRENEYRETTFETNNGEHVVVKQIAGMLPHVVETFVNEHDVCHIGQYLGIIRFGSRVDITFPTSSFKLLAKLDDRVKGISTRLCEFKSNV